MLSVPFHPNMIALAMWVSTRYSQVVFTSTYREGDKGLHGKNPCRAMDIRSRCYGDPKKVEEDINTHWLYDPKRDDKRCALLHNSGQGIHIHLQVCDKSRYEGGF